MQDLIEALTIFSKYVNIPNPTYCGHEVLMVLCPHEVEEDDRNRLFELSFTWDEDTDCWSSFRFGS